MYLLSYGVGKTGLPGTLVTVVFRSGNLSSYVPVMLRFALLFIIWKSHHYDRSTLSMLNDIYHQKFNFTSTYSCKEHWMSLITEKKV
ncbi:hypothetical protein P5673_024133 [Acropora cervicornis]|uniref:Uncharacterized protein n=1 Tax=Acropora cervicornis TaxID=6130 RepID=A0AAD9Q4K5_ACRCE|nr:hypothetical protein P5673_024133 [Acropora cervicornis]